MSSFPGQAEQITHWCSVVHGGELNAASQVPDVDLVRLIGGRIDSMVTCTRVSAQV